MQIECKACLPKHCIYSFDYTETNEAIITIALSRLNNIIENIKKESLMGRIIALQTYNWFKKVTSIQK